MSNEENYELTSMRRFMGHTAKVNAELPATKISVNAIQDVLKPGSTVSFDLPASWGTVSDVMLSAVLELTFPMSSLVQPLKIGDKANWVNLTPAQQSFYADENDFKYQLANGTDYSMDFQTLRGSASLGSVWTLTQKESGVIIDQMTLKKLTNYNAYKMATLSEEESLYFDRLHELNVYQHCPAYDSSISPQTGVSDYARCMTAVVVGDTLKVTKAINIMVPLTFGDTYPLEVMGDTRLDIQLNPDLNIFGSMPKIYTGHLSVCEEFGENLAIPNGLIAGAEYFPFYTLNGARNALAERASGESTVIRVGFRGLRLHTNDLLSIMGGPKALTTQKAVNGSNLLFAPSCAALSSGVLVNFQLTSLDLCAFVPSGVTANAPALYDLLQYIRDSNGSRVLRNVSVPVFIPASKIAGFHVEAGSRYQANAAAFVTDDNTTTNLEYTNSLAGADLSPEAVFSTGQVVMDFVGLVWVDIPVFNGVMGALYSQNAGVGGSAAQDVGVLSTAALTTNSAAGLNIAASNFTISYSVSTNSGGDPNQNMYSSVKVPFCRSNDAKNYWFESASAQAAAGTGKALSVLPTSWEMKNVSLKMNRLQVPEELHAVMKEEFRTNGFRITRVDTDTELFTLPNAGPQTNLVTTRFTQPYALSFGLAALPTTYVANVEQYLPNATFSELQLYQGDTQVVMRRPDDLICNVGGVWPVLLPDYENYGKNTTLYNTCTRLKGPGGNEFTLGLIRDAYANSLGIGVEGESDQLNSINIAALTRLRQQWKYFYAMGTDGGSAHIAPQTPFTFTFTPRIEFEAAAGVCSTYNLAADGTKSAVFTDQFVIEGNQYRRKAGLRSKDVTAVGQSFNWLANQSLYKDVYTPKINLVLEFQVLYRKQWVFTSTEQLGLGRSRAPLVTILE